MGPFWRDGSEGAEVLCSRDLASKGARAMLFMTTRRSQCPRVDCRVVISREREHSLDGECQRPPGPLASPKHLLFDAGLSPLSHTWWWWGVGSSFSRNKQIVHKSTFTYPTHSVSILGGQFWPAHSTYLSLSLPICKMMSEALCYN